MLNDLSQSSMHVCNLAKLQLPTAESLKHEKLAEMKKLKEKKKKSKLKERKKLLQKKTHDVCNCVCVLLAK